MEQYTRIRVNSFDISGYKGECQGQGTDGIGLGVFRFEKQTKLRSSHICQHLMHEVKLNLSTFRTAVQISIPYVTEQKV